jgi:predicted nuclease with TOPRIM domain
METLETSVKYQFDKEMVQFVKQLEIKTAMFGYDKTDVYKKFKDLLVRARSFCGDAVEKERAKIIGLEQQLEELKEAMSLMDQKATCLSSSKDNDTAEEDIAGEGVTVAVTSTALQEKSDPFVAERSSIEAQEQISTRRDEKCDMLPQTQDEVERFKERYSAIQEQIVALEDENSTLRSKLDQQTLAFEGMKRTLSDAKEEHKALEEQLYALLLEKEALKKKLKAYAEKEEILNYSEAILEEARLEGENIVREARVRAEQELFLYRARHRDEERAHEERIASLREEKKSLEQKCLSYRSYIGQGQNLMQEMKAYIERFNAGNLESGLPNDAHIGDTRIENDHAKTCDTYLAQDKSDTTASDELAEATVEDDR